MDKTIFVLIDACSFDSGTRNLGFLEHMTEYGQCAKYKVRGELPSLSRPIYVTLLTGVPTYVHGITANDVVETTSYENVFSLVKEHGGVTAAAAYSWMSEIYNRTPFNLFQDRVFLHSGGSIDHGIYYTDDFYPDSHVFADGEYLRSQFDPDFLMYHTMLVDEWGHVKGGDSFEYDRAMATVDTYLAMLIPQWLKAGYNIVITGDHGMNSKGLHGGNEPAQRDTPLYIFSNKVRKGYMDDEYISQLNVAPLLLNLLGLETGADMNQELEVIFW